ncbi:MAG: hypothetical protein COB02_06300 [Candidatus Cloacimonadota bacterium]|nr:MAG: hypothetical protein COB02_06300 [Candidatus Cloacimonadota bacterium]
MNKKYPHKIGEYRLSHESLASGESIAFHYHKGRAENCHILSGEATFIIEQTKIKKKVGESISIKKNINHSIRNDDLVSLEWLEVSIVLDHRIEMDSDSYKED